MKKSIILILVILLLGQAVFAQSENDNVSISVGIGPEVNMNSNFSGGLTLSGDYQLPVSAVKLAVGLTVTGSYDFLDTVSLETTAMLRWYFLSQNHTGLFGQVDLGIIVIFEDDASAVFFDSSLRAGFRIPLGDSFYIEPYGRFGYPSFLGAGVLAGMRFRSKPRSTNNNTFSNTFNNNISNSEGE